MSEYRKVYVFFHKRWCSFSIKDDEWLEKYNKIWNKVSNTFKKGFDEEPLCGEKKTKIKADEGKINTNFHNDKMLEKGSHCLSLVLIDSVFKMGKNYYPQVSLEECKNTAKEKEKLDITEDTEISYDESDESEGE